MPRLEQLLDMLKSEPNDTFLRYALAMEYAKASRFTEALGEFDKLLQHDPNYVPAYFMAGRTCEQDANPEKAKDFYRRGIATANKIGDTHAAGEIAEALRALD